MNDYERLQVMLNHEFDMNLIKQYEKYDSLKSKLAIAEMGRMVRSAKNQTEYYSESYQDDVRIWKKQVADFEMEHAGELNHLRSEYEYYKEMQKLKKKVEENEKIRTDINDYCVRLKNLFNRKCCIIPELAQKYVVDGMYYPFNIELKDSCTPGTEIGPEEKQKIENYTKAFCDGPSNVDGIDKSEQFCYSASILDIDKSEQRCIAVYYKSSILSTYYCLFMTHGMYIFNPNEKTFIFIKYIDIHSVRHEIIVATAAESNIGKSVSGFLSNIHKKAGDAFNNIADMIKKNKAVIFINEIPLYVDNSMSETEMELMCQFINQLKSMIDKWDVYECKHCHSRTVFLKGQLPGEKGCPQGTESHSKNLDDMTESQAKYFSWNKTHSWEKSMDNPEISIDERYLYQEVPISNSEENIVTNSENDKNAVTNNDNKTSPSNIIQDVNLSAGKNKTIAILLAIILGVLGAHRFYLGKWKTGLLYILFCWTGLTVIAGWIEAVIYIRTSKEKFDEKYNKGTA